MAQSILITGANGFIGQHCVAFLSSKNYRLVLAITDTASNISLPDNIIVRKFNLKQQESDLSGLFDAIDTVIHLAGIAHSQNVSKADYKSVNTEGTLKLARQAKASGVKRFIFISTVKVHGESRAGNDEPVFNENSAENPGDEYSKSKLEAERGLRQICSAGGMEYVIIRVPLVFGPGVKANYYSLMKLVSRNIPLPFSGIKNLRSFMYVENMAHLLDKIIQSATCKNKVYLVKDYDLSTSDLVTKIACAFGLKARLFYIPPGIIRSMARLLRENAMMEKLFGSLVIDDARIRQELAWQPVVDATTGIRRTVEWFENSRGSA